MEFSGTYVGLFSSNTETELATGGATHASGLTKYLVLVAHPLLMYYFTLQNNYN